MPPGQNKESVDVRKLAAEIAAHKKAQDKAAIIYGSLVMFILFASGVAVGVLATAMYHR